MVNIDRMHVREAFKAYVSDYDLSDVKVKLKVDHTYRVAAMCDAITEDLGLSAADRDLAWLSGMLHDIGRFEQLRQWHPGSIRFCSCDDVPGSHGGRGLCSGAPYPGGCRHDES